MHDLRHDETLDVDVCVVGGGMAGLCAALAAARHGARTVLIQDRPVLGGNASSEIRMWICGAHGAGNKETGLLEEIQLENAYRNHGLVYSVWDHVLYGKAVFQPNLRLLLNTTCVDAVMDGNRIAGIRAWQLTSQTWFTVNSRIFIDCSGDSILGATTGAAFRYGREARTEFDEDIEPPTADRKTMGNSILIQSRKTGRPQPFTPPSWAYVFDSPRFFETRMRGVNTQNFWWMEIGGIHDTCRDAEYIRDELLKIAYGVWDYVKNRASDRAEAADWAIEWIGSLPGKRESRRYEGPHILTQNDIREGGRFDDIVAYGGWSMDDHHPAGLLYPGKPTIFHPAPSPYGIPYRCLYSRNLANLLFAGRNISATHAALSSTRVMATCSLLGQAAGTAAALCVAQSLTPAGVYPNHIATLQQALMEDDVWLPGLRRTPDGLAGHSRLAGPGEGVERLIDGVDRDRPDASHAWVGRPGDAVTWTFDAATRPGSIRLVFDSDLGDTKRMPASYPVAADQGQTPRTLVRAFRIEAVTATGAWETVYRETENYQRLREVPLACETRAVRFIAESTWGSEAVRLFGFEPQAVARNRLPLPLVRPSFGDRVEACPPADLAPPDSVAAKRQGSA
ncbi:MAG: FAD-dependent oxidoreductase [Lentisphaerae bacterium]|nr:FAD-dependent oxidoreductase [Lentisphaerota bacterium]